MSGSMLAPALSSISRDLNIDDATTQMTLSIFVLSFAFGPMVLAPLSEIFGRKPVWIASGTFYVICSTVCGFANNNELMIAGRFFAGLGASAEFAVSSRGFEMMYR
jgi:MFS family permease